MKKVIATICLFVTVFGVAQEKLSKEEQETLEKSLSMLDSKIDMTVDSAVFNVNEGNTYFTENQEAGIIAMVAPRSFPKMKEDLEKKSDGVIDKGEMTIDGQKILFIKKMKEKEGRDFVITVYCKANDAESSIMLTSFFEKGKESIYKPHAEKAIATAKLVK